MDGEVRGVCERAVVTNVGNGGEEKSVLIWCGGVRDMATTCGDIV